MALNLVLPSDIRDRLQGLGDVIAACSPDVEFAYLFGSAATGALTPRSDVDVAIHATAGADGQAVRLLVARALASHIRSDAVDVVLLNTAPISLSGRVLSSRRVILERSAFARHRFESLTLRKFHDFRIREHRMLESRRANG